MDVKNVTCYSFDLSSLNSLAYLRLVGPLSRLGINVINGFENGRVDIEKVLQGDAVFIQRNFPGMYNDYRKIITLAHEEGKSIIFDLDDLLILLPDDHPAYQTFEYTTSLLPMLQALRESDLVIVSSQKLKQVLSIYNENIAVLPNYFDEHIWKVRPPIPCNMDERPIVIGFMGTDSHKPDLEYLSSSLLNVCLRYPDKVALRFWGLEPPDDLRPYSQVVSMPGFSPQNQYKDFVNYFQTQSADIFVAPLKDNLFNRCKSSVKYLDYSALGAPGVYSSLEPYLQIVVNEENGLLASSPQEWTDQLIRLIENETLRLQLAVNAQKTIQREWSLDRNAYRWQEVFNLLDMKNSPKYETVDLNIIRSINNQLFEITARAEKKLARKETDFYKKAEEQHNYIQTLQSGIAEKDQAIQSLNVQIDNLEKANQSLSEQISKNIEANTSLHVNLNQVASELELSRSEVVAYKQSVSWKITRPLRMIKNLFSSSKQ
jgi:processive 1,2-diacylglycerol beta-glucosyltransferase